MRNACKILDEKSQRKWPLAINILNREDNIKMDLTRFRTRMNYFRTVINTWIFLTD